MRCLGGRPRERLGIVPVRGRPFYKRGGVKGITGVAGGIVLKARAIVLPIFVDDFMIGDSSEILSFHERCT